MTIDSAFEKYFHDRADLADKLAENGWVLEARTIAAASLDALASIWLHDYPDVKSKLVAELAGTPPPSIRMTRFLKLFAAADEEVHKVAVVCFAEDWKRYDTNSAALAARLLAPRLGKGRGDLPHSHKDVPISLLVKEEPELAMLPHIVQMAEEYEYGALLYSFYRCPLVHHASPSKRTHGFTRGTEVMYMPLHSNHTSISFGPALITRWLRCTATGYVSACARDSIRPANDFDPGKDPEGRLEGRWKRLLGSSRKT